MSFGRGQKQLALSEQTTRNIGVREYWSADFRSERKILKLFWLQVFFSEEDWQ
jgi:hypothetical protein